MTFPRVHSSPLSTPPCWEDLQRARAVWRCQPVVKRQVSDVETTMRHLKRCDVKA